MYVSMADKKNASLPQITSNMLFAWKIMWHLGHLRHQNGVPFPDLLGSPVHKNRPSVKIDRPVPVLQTGK